MLSGHVAPAPHQVAKQRVAVVHLDREVRVHVRQIGAERRDHHLGDVAQALVVDPRALDALARVLVDARELAQDQPRLERRHAPAVELRQLAAQLGSVVERHLLVEELELLEEGEAEHPEREGAEERRPGGDVGGEPVPDLLEVVTGILERERSERRARALRQLRVARDQHAAEEGVHVLVLAEAEDAGVAEAPDRAPGEACAEGLRGVLDQRHAALARDARDHVHVAREAVQVRDEHGAGVAVHDLLDLCGIDVAGLALDVREDGHAARSDDHVHHVRDGVGREDDLLAGPDQALHREMDRDARARRQHCVRRAEGGQRLLELGAGSAALPAAGEELAADRGVRAGVVVEAVAGKGRHQCSRSGSVERGSITVRDLPARCLFRQAGRRSRDTLRRSCPAPTCSPSSSRR